MLTPATFQRSGCPDPVPDAQHGQGRQWVLDAKKANGKVCIFGDFATWTA